MGSSVSDPKHEAEERVLEQPAGHLMRYQVRT